MKAFLSEGPESGDPAGAMGTEERTFPGGDWEAPLAKGMEGWSSIEEKPKPWGSMQVTDIRVEE